MDEITKIESLVNSLRALGDYVSITMSASMLPPPPIVLCVEPSIPSTLCGLPIRVNNLIPDGYICVCQPGHDPVVMKVT